MVSCKPINPESAIFFRDQLRVGRATALRDAEGFQETLFILERLGLYLTGAIDGLGKYQNCIQTIAAKSPLAEEIPKEWRQYHPPFSAMYELVRKARNDALHQGAFARHLTGHVVQLALVLEDALMSDAYTVSDYMVPEPVCASTWQPISFVRQQMLANSFTYLPIFLDKDGQRNWYLLSDTNIVKYLQPDRKKRLAKTIQEALATKDLQVEIAQCHTSDTLVSDVLEDFTGHPILIIDKVQQDRLLGILTAFDVL